MPRTSRVRLGALLSEAAAGVVARPGRAALTSLGTVLGVASLVATMGLASTAGAQILTRFDALAATDVTVEARAGIPSAIPWTAEDDLRRLNGVVEVGTITPVVDHEGRSPVIAAVGVARAETDRVSVAAVSPGALDAIVATMGTGRPLTPADEELALPVAVLGPAAAQRLGIRSTLIRPTVFLDGRPVTVVGILAEVGRRPWLLGAVIIPTGLARSAFALDAPGLVQIETVLGANDLVRDQAPLALAPNAPDLLVASSPPLPAEIRTEVASDVRALLLLLGAVSMVVGALGIANVTLVSVLERTGEIGIRRAMGALRRHVALQFLVESTFLGLVGGILGTSLGVLVVVAVSLARDWFPVLSFGVALGAPLLGALVGFVAGIHPAHRAAAVEPAESLRSAL